MLEWRCARTAKDLVAARVGSCPYIKRRLSNDKGFGNEASARYYVDLDNMLDDDGRGLH